MLRYKLHRDRVVLYENENFSGRKTEILPGLDNAENFVDILDQNATSYRLRVYRPNGEIVTGWVLGKVLEGMIRIHDEHLLFDGRFNAVQLKWKDCCHPDVGCSNPGDHHYEN